MVGRSKAVSGPYVDRTGQSMAAGGAELFLDTELDEIGPGQIGIEPNTGHLFSYHFYNAAADGTPTLGLRNLEWGDDGWPIAGRKRPAMPWQT